ncbi:hypothetical protein ANACOL_01226 [Anaerotruncus colihominis DSM 17241]|uniref:Uncharacterized protein n=1 Tax=Anaerotruncus colihominis DSM 17241 TaxID=445972 RepID=B0P8Y0_9FIRM|nr:hypothetical protein ANACOL_01226 [Anaerotruncus colihominis DSM 17241]
MLRPCEVVAGAAVSQGRSKNALPGGFIYFVKFIKSKGGHILWQIWKV